MRVRNFLWWGLLVVWAGSLVSEDATEVCREGEARAWKKFRPEETIEMQRTVLKDTKLLWATGFYHAQLMDTLGDFTKARASSGLQTREDSFYFLQLQEFRRSAKESYGARCLRGGLSTPDILGQLAGLPDPAKDSYPSLQDLLELHASKYLAVLWQHRLLENRAARSAAVRVKVQESWGLWLRGNERDSLMTCNSQHKSGFYGFLMFSDGGDPGCHSSSTLHWLDPRGEATNLSPRLLQLGSESQICMRVGEVWIVPGYVPFYLPSHNSRGERGILIFRMEFDDATSTELTSFLSKSLEGGESPNEGSTVFATSLPGRQWTVWSSAWDWNRLSSTVTARWPTPVFSTVDHLLANRARSVLDFLSNAARAETGGRASLRLTKECLTGLKCFLAGKTMIHKPQWAHLKDVRQSLTGSVCRKSTTTAAFNTHDRCCFGWKCTAVLS
mmetsp:Transcript_2810/g.4576  ORF Transcript_2810/g.4576 Transcript_2810/m.4576 type:complete len:444 (+) Transcript_2810:86-1417(+)